MSRFYVNPNPSFKRAAKLISDITNANEAQITTTTDHEYSDGDIVRIIVPNIYGMKRINNLSGKIKVTGAQTFTIDINTTTFNTFSIPAPLPWYVNATAQVLPVGEITANLGAATENI